MVRDLFGREGKKVSQGVKSFEEERNSGEEARLSLPLNGGLPSSESPMLESLVLPKEIVESGGDLVISPPSPESSSLSPPSPASGKPVLDFGKALEGLTSGDSGSAVAGIREVGKPNADGSNLPMISDIKNPIAFTACQIHKAYCEELGYSTRAWVYDKALFYAYQHSCAVSRGKDGNRVTKMLNAFKIEFQKEFEIKKHSKAESALGS